MRPDCSPEALHIPAQKPVVTAGTCYGELVGRMILGDLNPDKLYVTWII